MQVHGEAKELPEFDLVTVEARDCHIRDTFFGRGTDAKVSSRAEVENLEISNNQHGFFRGS